MGLQRSLIYVLFVLVVVYLLTLRYQKAQTITLWQTPLKDSSGTIVGKAFCRRRSDGSEYLVIKLKAKVPEAAVVLVRRKDYTSVELGRFDGASFIITLPPGLLGNDIIGITLQGIHTGRIWAEGQRPSAEP